VGKFILLATNCHKYLPTLGANTLNGYKPISGLETAQKKSSSLELNKNSPKTFWSRVSDCFDKMIVLVFTVGVIGTLVVIAGYPLLIQIWLYLESGVWVSLPATYMFSPMPVGMPLLGVTDMFRIDWVWLSSPDSWFGAHKIIKTALDTIHYSLIPLFLLFIFCGFRFKD
jgi:hypothetical protein